MRMMMTMMMTITMIVKGMMFVQLEIYLKKKKKEKKNIVILSLCHPPPSLSFLHTHTHTQKYLFKHPSLPFLVLRECERREKVGGREEGERGACDGRGGNGGEVLMWLLHALLTSNRDLACFKRRKRRKEEESRSGKVECSGAAVFLQAFVESWRYLEQA